MILLKQTTPMTKTRTTIFKESIDKLLKEIEKNNLKTAKSTKKELKDAVEKVCEKYKIIANLNKLDEYILNGMSTNRDVKSREYIEEVFKSYGVEDKNRLFEILDGYAAKIKDKARFMREKIEEIDKKIDDIKNSNKEYEKKYKQLVARVESVMHRKI